MVIRAFTAVVYQEDEVYVSECPEVGTSSYGSTIEEAIENLKEATELYLEEFPQNTLKQAGVTPEQFMENL